MKPGIRLIHKMLVMKVLQLLVTSHSLSFLVAHTKKETRPAVLLRMSVSLKTITCLIPRPERHLFHVFS